MMKSDENKRPKLSVKADLSQWIQLTKRVLRIRLILKILLWTLRLFTEFDD